EIIGNPCLYKFPPCFIESQCRCRLCICQPCLVAVLCCPHLTCQQPCHQLGIGVGCHAPVIFPCCCRCAVACKHEAPVIHYLLIRHVGYIPLRHLYIIRCIVIPEVINQYIFGLCREFLFILIC